MNRIEDDDPKFSPRPIILITGLYASDSINDLSFNSLSSPNTFLKEKTVLKDDVIFLLRILIHQTVIII